MFGRILLYLFKKYMSLFVNNPPVLDKDKNFPEAKEFEAAASTIYQELENFIAQNWEKLPSFSDVDAAQMSLIANDHYQWKVLILKMYGAYVNTKISPTLLNLVKKHDALVSSAILSCIEAGKHIPPHCGPNKLVLRYTLPLKVPTGECYLVVDGQKLPMQEGVGILWDDTFMHEVVNNTQGVRIALLLDLKRPLPKHIDMIYEFVLALARKTKRFKKACAAAAL